MQVKALVVAGIAGGAVAQTAPSSSSLPVGTVVFPVPTSSSNVGTVVFPVLSAPVSSSSPVGSVLFPALSGNATVVTQVVTAYTTYCPGPTTFAVGSMTYTVTSATTLTITNCPCTITQTRGANAMYNPQAVAAAEGRSVAYSLALAVAGVVGVLAL
ncbi:hypothetical protein UVI_02006890 [Ustilaginoidea virens]|uniref:Mmc protein n=1 Tax=Ustilaginoidea virens TaxID=1159556 RepID=A0A1B5KW20_USTVR|nr:hypothetical protein UVI_02006890 [Ustilaginoidea virens]